MFRGPRQIVWLVVAAAGGEWTQVLAVTFLIRNIAMMQIIAAGRRNAYQLPAGANQITNATTL